MMPTKIIDAAEAAYAKSLGIPFDIASTMPVDQYRAFLAAINAAVDQALTEAMGAVREVRKNG